MGYTPSSIGYGGSYQRRPPRPSKPFATYTLLGAMLAVYILEVAVFQARGKDTYLYLFTVDIDWMYRPWSLVTSTLSHSLSNLSHLLFNGLFLFFFGPAIEKIIGTARYVALFLITGAVSGVAQVELEYYLSQYDPSRFEVLPALGASGALMALFAVTVILMPRSKMIIFPLPVPIPIWAGGLFFVTMDLLGAFSGSGRVGNFAHLSGVALGLFYGWMVKRDLAKRGLRLAYG